MVACEPSVPRRYIQPDDFEALLYDYQVAKTMAEENDSIGDVGADSDRAQAWEALRQSVFSKHGVTEEMFDSSLVYYTRHSDRLYKMYVSMQDRMEREAVRWGADAREISRYGADVDEGDTANIWPGERSIVLMHAAPYNYYSYMVEADSTFGKGDKVILSFDTQFLYQEGKKDCAVTLAVTFVGDSVASRTTHTTRNSHFSLEITDKDTLGIKDIKGFFCIANDMNAPKTTMRTLFVSNIRLVRMATVRPADVVADVGADIGADSSRALPPDSGAVRKGAVRPQFKDSTNAAIKREQSSSLVLPSESRVDEVNAAIKREQSSSLVLPSESRADEVKVLHPGKPLLKNKQ